MILIEIGQRHVNRSEADLGKFCLEIKNYSYFDFTSVLSKTNLHQRKAPNEQGKVTQKGVISFCRIHHHCHPRLRTHTHYVINSLTSLYICTEEANLFERVLDSMKEFEMPNIGSQGKSLTKKKKFIVD